MSGLLSEQPLEWAVPLSPDRIALAGVFGVRALRYMGEATAAGPVIEGLRVVAVDCAEAPMFHSSTGLYAFVRLPPGPRRIELTDPARRFSPTAVTATIPDRSAIRAALEHHIAPLALPRPLIVDAALRVGPDSPLPPGLTAVWGVVRELSGAPVPLARITCATAGGGSVVTYAQRDGSYVLVLPAEKPASFATPKQFVFPRALILHAPRPLFAATLLGPSFVTALPANLDSVDPNAPGGIFESRTFRLRDATGTLTPGPNPPLPVRAAERTRWDIELT